ncbi:MAG: cysteine--tRNA ligase [Prevotella sp.]|nr:cysteine--tRNA ligase [Prevotella sp.]
MEQTLLIYNTLTRKKEAFKSINPGRVGMYVCGPTVYGDAHLGHARPAITFDILYRYLQHLGYKVRYVRNITDVGHLEHDADEGEDKIAKKARLEQVEPMEIAGYYTRRFNSAMEKLNVLPPSIEPHATGHIIEQQQLVKQILDRGYAYVSNGSVYFDIEKYNKDYKYGILSGRSLENIKDASRDTLAGVGEKKNQADFALWKQAQPQHIMRWPWLMGTFNHDGVCDTIGEGFPGWHCECTAMGRKYLGEEFDIHGGGMDLVFPHHECEIAQAQAAMGHQAVHYWMHNNMITINGQKMGKSYNNFITLDQFFTGNHELLTKAFSPMTIRFFILSAHYRGTVDFSSEALEAAEKGMARLMQGLKDLKRIQPAKGSSPEVAKYVSELEGQLYDAMNDDLQTPIVISLLFEACHQVNLLVDCKQKISADDLEQLSKVMHLWTEDILGLTAGEGQQAAGGAMEKVMQMVLDIRAKAKADKDWATSDKIRDDLNAAGVIVKDTPDGAVWEI